MSDSLETPTSVSQRMLPLLSELAPDLQPVRHLGSGSTADVYLAREVSLQRLVAVKVLRPALVSDPIVLKRFEREAQAAARVSHPNVTGIYRVGRLSTGVPFIVMEYVEGRSLLDLKFLRGHLPIDECRSLIASVAGALAAVHAHAIIHRDVRPESIIVEHGSRRPVLTDFGIASRMTTGTHFGTQLTAIGTLVGPPQYMSPEQLKGEPATAESDVYALGIVAWELLTGSRPDPPPVPSPGRVPEATAMPIRPAAALPPEPWVRVVEQCLNRDPARRPTAEEVKRALEAMPEAVGRLQTPMETFFAEMKRRRVYRVLVGYGAAAITLLGVAGIIDDAFDLPPRIYQLVVLLTLAGFPVAGALSWVFDLSAGGIQRTAAMPDTAGIQRLLSVALALSVLLAGAVAWLLLS